MLEVIFELLADPVLPTSTVAFSSTCKGLLNAMPLQVLELLVERHGRVKDLCRRLRPSNRYDLTFPSPWRPPPTPDQLRNFCPCLGFPCATMASCKKLHEAPELEFLCQHVTNEETTTVDMQTMAMILRTNGLPRLQSFDFHYQASYTRWDRQTGCVGVDIRPFCQGLVRTSFVSLRSLALQYNRFGPSGAEALAAALGRGATPALGSLSIGMNEIGNQGVAALAAPLRKLRLLQDLGLSENGIGDDGVASLVADLGNDDFKALKELSLFGNELTDVSCTSLLAVSKAGLLPSIEYFELVHPGSGASPASEEVIEAFEDEIDFVFASRAWRVACLRRALRNMSSRTSP